MDDLKGNVDLMKIIDTIEPVTLGSVSYSDQLNQLEKTFKTAFKKDCSNLLLVIHTIKESKPCYKRDLLIQVLDRLVFESNENMISEILNQITSRGFLWKEMANSLVALPDVIANCNILSKFIRFKLETFYDKLLNDLYLALKLHCDKNDKLTNEQNWFSLTLLGRIAIISGFCQLVWEKFTHKVIESESSRWKSLIGNILTLPLKSGDTMATQFEIFIEPLILPIFYNLTPSHNSGKFIHELLVGQDILRNDSFEYIICNKLILQTNYNQSRHRQRVILFNIFSYLALLTSESFIDNHHVPQSTSSSSSFPTTAIDRSKETSLLIKTLVTIGQSWSSQTKILFRSYEHNRYITSAFLIAFRFALECDRQRLVKFAELIESSIMQGFTFYLDRASVELRNIAMCLGELLLPKLHDLLDSVRTRQDKHSQDGSELPRKLDFDIKWEGDCLELKNMFYSKVDQLFEKDLTKKGANESKGCIDMEAAVKSTTREKPIVCDIDSSFDEIVRELSGQRDKLVHEAPKKPLIEVLDDDDDDDLKPYDDDDNQDNEDMSGEEMGEDLSAPIYLRDCINGLVENKNPRYVKLCLIKAGSLIEELSGVGEEDQEVDCRRVRAYKATNRQLTYIKRSSLTRLGGAKANEVGLGNDAIRDNAIELAKILLYLDDQYNIEGFSGLRIRGLISLAIVEPELVVKYLLDEYNGDNRNIRHQLDILQVLVSSAQNLSSKSWSQRWRGPPQLTTTSSTKTKRTETTNGFAKYAQLYFYGIIHRLKISNELSIVVSDRQWLNFQEEEARDSSYYTATTTFISDMKKEKRNIMKTNIINYDFVDDSIGSIKREDNCDVVDGGGDNCCVGATTATTTTTTTTSRLDDSYLLSRILFSISLIIKCLNQQPVACKLSNDLLDVLAAYRHHPDGGVRKSIISCLTVIRDSTPSVYLEEYLCGKIEKLFGLFLANECRLIGRLK